MRGFNGGGFLGALVFHTALNFESSLSPCRQVAQPKPRPHRPVGASANVSASIAPALELALTLALALALLVVDR